MLNREKHMTDVQRTKNRHMIGACDLIVA